MARGWESKSVDDQIAEKFSQRAPSFTPPTAREQERESLTLQRKRILSLIEGSSNPRFIAQQRQGLAHFDQKLEQLID